jgi:hypothetical protein
MDRSPLDPRTLLARWTLGEWVIAVASLAMVVALLLDWTTVSCSGSSLCNVEQPVPVTGVHGWAWLAFGGVLAVLSLLVARTILAGAVRLPLFTVSDSTVYMALGVVELAGCVLFWAENPSITVGPTTIGLGPGWYLALFAAAGTVAGGRLMRGQRRPPEQLELFDESDRNRTSGMHPTGSSV